MIATRKNAGLASGIVLAALLVADVCDGRDFAIRKDTWTNPSAPALVVMEDGSWFAYWQAENSYGHSAAQFAWSFDHGVSWTVGGVDWLPGGGFPPSSDIYGLSYTPSMAVDRGEGIVLVGNISGRVGHQLGTLRLHREGETFRWESGPYLDPELLVHSRDIAFDSCTLERSSSGRLYLAYTKQAGEGRQGFDSRVEFRTSDDQGRTWSMPTLLSSAVAQGSKLVRRRDGRITVTWFDLTSSRLISRTSIDDGDSFGPEAVVCETSLNQACLPPGEFVGRHPHYDPRYRCVDFVTPVSIDIDRSGGSRDGWIYLVWPEQVSGTFVATPTAEMSEREPNDTIDLASTIELGVSNVGISRGTEVYPEEQDFFSLNVTKGETIGLSGHVRWHSPQYPGIETSCYPILVYARAADEALNVYQAYSYLQLETAGLSPTMYVTARESGPMYFLAPAASGRLNRGYDFVVNKLEPSPETVAGDQRDIVMVVSPDGGLTWSKKRIVSDGATGYDQSVPTVTVDSHGVVHVAWCDWSDDAPRGIFYSVRASTSTDGGDTFTPSQSISDGVVDRSGLDYLTFGGNLGNQFVFQADGDSLYSMWPGVSAERYVHLVGKVLPITHIASSVRWSTGVRLGRSARVSVDILESVPEGDLSLWKRVSSGAWQQIEVKPLAGPANIGFVDPLAPVDDMGFEYRVLITPRGGLSEWSEPLTSLESVEGGERGPIIVVNQNPARGSVAEYRVIPGARGPVKLSFFDVSGRRVREFELGEVPAEGAVVSWDLRDTMGRLVPAGRYFSRAEASGSVTSVSVTVVR